MPEIAKCPFCGGEGHLAGGENCWWVTCTCCKADMMSSSTKAEAIAAWNRRAQTDGCEWEKRQLLDSFGDARTGYHCSKCGFLTDIEWPFCPKCGAKMNGGRKIGG